MEIRANIVYKRIQEIGVGQGMNSKVFEVEDLQMGNGLVAKEIPKSSFLNNLADYYNEARVMFSSRHRNIVPVQYAAECDDHICLVMPYFRNGSLQSRLEINPLTLKDVIILGQEILSGVGHIHSTNHIHLDIKPSNILFSDTGTPMVADFGQARALNQNGLVTKLPAFYSYGIPPEVYTFQAVSAASDIYQVGLTLYRALNGDYIFQTQTLPITTEEEREELKARIIGGCFPDRDTFLPHVPPKLRNLIRKALHVNSNRRFNSARDFSDALGRVNLAHNWQVNINASTNEWQWRSCRTGKADLLVCLMTDKSKWSIEIYTESSEGRRRAISREQWEKKTSFEESIDYLDGLFSFLEQR